MSETEVFEFFSVADDPRAPRSTRAGARVPGSLNPPLPSGGGRASWLGTRGAASPPRRDWPVCSAFRPRTLAAGPGARRERKPETKKKTERCAAADWPGHPAFPRPRALERPVGPPPRRRASPSSGNAGPGPPPRRAAPSLFPRLRGLWARVGRLGPRSRPAPPRAAAVGLSSGAPPRAAAGPTVMILPQVHLRKPCYDFYFL